MRNPWMRAAAAGVAISLLAVSVWLWYSYAEPRQRARDLQDDLQSQRLSAESCRMDLSMEEASFRSLDETVDSLRRRVDGYEALDPQGVPADSFEIYLEVFDRYNDAVARWEEQASELESDWADCSEVVEEHNRMADSLRSILVEMGALEGGEDEQAAAVPTEELATDSLPTEELASDPVASDPVASDPVASEAVTSDAVASDAVASDAAEIAYGAGQSAPSIEATDEDWRILRETVRWAQDSGVDTLPIGEAVARIGLSFLGTSYIPRTLEVPGRERLVVNLRALDCVTLVESALAIAHTVKTLPPDGEWTENELRTRYSSALMRLRYRGGVMGAYPTRLHYFSEWIDDAAAKSVVRPVTEELGGVLDVEPIDFMSTNPDAYRQLENPAFLEEIRRIESRISREPRVFISEDRIAEAADGIRTGDVIAATSTVEGLDIAHTGIALWRDGELHLLHAPLVGDSVQVSPRTLAQRIQEIEGQDGIMVARPLEPPFPRLRATIPD